MERKAPARLPGPLTAPRDVSRQATAAPARPHAPVSHGRDETRLVVGRGRYLGDLRIPGALEMAVVRSPFAHAAIGEIDITDALATPGVRAVLTGRDLSAHLRPFPGIIREAPPYFPLAIDTARYAGEPVAIVVAEDRYRAEDGAGVCSSTTRSSRWWSTPRPRPCRRRRCYTRRAAATSCGAAATSTATRTNAFARGATT